MPRPPKASPETAGTEDRYRAPALDKGLDILELLSTQSGGMTRAEIVKAMDRSQSEIYRMLERLVARDYVSRSPEGDRYTLTMKLFVLAHRHPPVRRLVARAQPLMDGFARDARQSCHLVAPDRDAALVVAQASCPAVWEFGVRVGAPLDLLGTGSGQMLLAFQAPHDREALLVSWAGTDKIAQIDALEPALATHRADGYRIAESGQIRGVSDISAPILSPDGHAIAVLTCPYIERLDDDSQIGIEETLALLRKVTQTLSLC